MPPSYLHHHLLLPFPSPIQPPLNPFPASCSPFHPPPKPLTLPLPPRPLASYYSSAAEVDDDDLYDDDEVIVGDCLVFEDGAFEHPDLDLPSPPPPTYRHRRKAAAASSGRESLVPERWREAAEEINLTKKDKRRIAHGLRFGSRLERRPPPAVAAADEYGAYREGRLAAELNHVALDEMDPPEPFTLEKVEEHPAPLPPEPGARVAPRNPRMGMDGCGLEDIEQLFSSGKYVPGEIEDGKSPTSRRKLFTDEEKVLLNKRVPDLEVATSSKWLPLHSLAASGEFYLLDKLLKHNVDINAVDKDGLSAIHKAIISKKQAIINYLLRNSANPFIRDKDGATLMHYAVQTACSQTIKILLLYNVDINHPDDYGWTPLHLAVQTHRTDIVKLLLIKGADRTLKTQDGLTPLELCLHLGHHLRTYELIKLLKSCRVPKQHDSVQYLEGL